MEGHLVDVDMTSESGRHLLQRLQDDQVIWLTTVNAHGQPQSSPVWFLWRDGGFDLYSQPAAPKLQSIAAQSNVSLNLNTSPNGEDVATFEGIARVVSERTPGTDDPDYVAKYSRLIPGWEPDDFARSFDTRIRVEPSRLRAC